MTPAAQALDVRISRFAGSRVLRVSLLCLSILPVSACATGGFDLSKAEVDRTIVTGGAQPSTGSVPEQLSDETTIRNAVSSADLEQLNGEPLAWANADTGSRGAITALAEERQDGMLCRRFTTSRESFDGVSLFQGKACLAPAGSWRMREFGAL